MNEVGEHIKTQLQLANIDVKDREKVAAYIREELVETAYKSEEEIQAYVDSLMTWLYIDEVNPNAYEYKEILRLNEMLNEADIPHRLLKGKHGGYHVHYIPENGNEIVCSVIQTPTSYGVKEDLLEIQGLMTKQEMQEKQDDVLGFLTAENVFERISNHYQSYLEAENQFMQMFAPFMKLLELLEEANIPFKLNEALAGFQILYKQPSTGHSVSVVASILNREMQEGKVEVMSRDYDAMPMEIQDVFEYICKLQNS